MSLEQAIQENTIAIQDLLAFFKTQPVINTAHIGAQEVVAENVKTEGIKKSKKVAAETPVVVNEETEEAKLAYKDVADAFLKLVSRDREKAIAILTAHKLTSLKLAQPEDLPSIYEEVNKVLERDDLV